ncbi:MAG: alpha/beta hydrolase [Nocardioides sp.]
MADRSAQTPAHVTADDYAEVVAGRAEAEAATADEFKEAVAEVHDLDADGVSVRLYRPAGASADKGHGGAPGTLLYLHGGGFVFGGLITHDGFVRRLANRTGWAVLAVDYRLAPEHPYPAAVEDTEIAAAWWGREAASFGLTGPIVPIGDSAGAALAQGLTLRHPGTYRAQILVYPFLDPSGDSYDHTLEAPDLDLEACRWFWTLYFADSSRQPEVDADPLRASSYADQPHTFVQFAAHDVLVPTGRQLVQRMRADGVMVIERTYPGVGHGYWRRADNDQAEPSLSDIASFLDGSLRPEQETSGTAGE